MCSYLLYTLCHDPLKFSGSLIRDRLHVQMAQFFFRLICRKSRTRGRPHAARQWLHRPYSFRPHPPQADCTYVSRPGFQNSALWSGDKRLSAAGYLPPAPSLRSTPEVLHHKYGSYPENGRPVPIHSRQSAVTGQSSRSVIIIKSPTRNPRLIPPAALVRKSTSMPIRFISLVGSTTSSIGYPS